MYTISCTKNRIFILVAVLAALSTACSYASQQAFNAHKKRALAALDRLNDIKNNIGSVLKESNQSESTQTRTLQQQKCLKIEQKRKLKLLKRMVAENEREIERLTKQQQELDWVLKLKQENQKRTTLDETQLSSQCIAQTERPEALAEQTLTMQPTTESSIQAKQSLEAQILEPIIEEQPADPKTIFIAQANELIKYIQSRSNDFLMLSNQTQAAYWRELSEKRELLMPLFAADLINSPINEQNQTLLLALAGSIDIGYSAEQCEIISDMLEIGADPLMIDYNGNNALHLAAQQGNITVLKTLIEWLYTNNKLDEALETTNFNTKIAGHACSSQEPIFLAVIAAHWKNTKEILSNFCQALFSIIPALAQNNKNFNDFGNAMQFKFYGSVDGVTDFFRQYGITIELTRYESLLTYLPNFSSATDAAHQKYTTKIEQQQLIKRYINTRNADQRCPLDLALSLDAMRNDGRHELPAILAWYGGQPSTYRDR